MKTNVGKQMLVQDFFLGIKKCFTGCLDSDWLFKTFEEGWLRYIDLGCSPNILAGANELIRSFVKLRQ